MVDTYISKAGLKKLEVDLKVLKGRKSQLSLDIGEAREKGDLKENAEYHSAKERLGEVMNRISKIQDKIDTAKLIDDLDIPKDTVAIGVKVTLLDIEEKEEIIYTLVGDDESDPAEGKISVNSPMAQGILGKKPGDEAMVELPAGSRRFKVIKTDLAV